MRPPDDRSRPEARAFMILFYHQGGNRGRGSFPGALLPGASMDTASVERFVVGGLLYLLCGSKQRACPGRGCALRWLLLWPILLHADSRRGRLKRVVERRQRQAPAQRQLQVGGVIHCEIVRSRQM